MASTTPPASPPAEAAPRAKASSGQEPAPPPQPEPAAVELTPVPKESGESQGERTIFVFLRALGRAAEKGVQMLDVSPSPGLDAPPPPKLPGFLRRHLLFLLCVVLPTLLAAIYFGLFATDVYTSESRYVVRSPNQKSPPTGLGGVLQGSGFSGFSKVPDEVMAVSEYITSRDALQLLQDRLGLREAWSSGSVDLFQRFDPLNWDDSFEALYEFYLRHVGVHAQPTSGITTLTASSFDPNQAYGMNSLLLGEAERLVNQINERARQDLIKFAENQVQVAEDKAKAAALAVSAFRNREGVVNPEQQTQLHFQHISRLQEELMKTRAQLTQLKVFAPDSPHPPALELRARTLDNAIAAEMEKITGGEKSLASKAAEYERLALERQFADSQLSSALASLEIARSEAQRQQLYLETIARPSLPDEATQPRRIRGVLTVLVLGLVAWGIMSMLLAGVREHAY